MAVEAVERRLMLSVTQTNFGTGETFTWDTLTQGRDVLDSPIQLRSLLDSPITNIANTIFLDLAGITGDVTQKGHEGEISVLEFEFGADRDHSGTDAGGPNFTELHVVMRASRATSQLISSLQAQTVITTGELSYVNTSTAATTFRTTLDKVTIDSYRSSTAASGALTEELTLRFDTAQVEVISGANNYFYAWNISAQGGSVSDSALPDRSFIDDTSYLPATEEAFLRIDGIPGSATAKGHENTIDLDGFAWSIDSTANGTAFGALRFVSTVSKQTPKLIDAAALGTVIADADLFLRKTIVGSGIPIWTLDLDLDNVIITSHRISSVPSGNLAEEFTLSFSAYKLTESGSAFPTQTVSYDLASSPGTVADPSPGAREVLFETRAASNPQLFFLNLSGVPGETVQKGFEAQIAVVDWEWGVDRRNGAPRFNHVNLVAGSSIATPRIQQRQIESTLIPSAILSITNSTGTVLQRLTLTNVKVDSFRVNTLHAGVPADEYQLSFDTALFTDVASSVSNNADLTAVGATFAPIVHSGRSILDNTPPGGLYSDAVAYLKLNGINGEVITKGYEDSLDVLSFEWGQITRDGVTFDQLHVVTTAGKASPALMSAVANGSIIVSGSLDAFRPAAAGGFFRSYWVSLVNAKLTSVQASATAACGGKFTEELTFEIADFTANASPPSGSSVAYSPTGTLAFAATTPAHPEAITERGNAVGIATTGMYLDLDQIPGSVTQKGQEGKIEVTGFEWAIDNTGSVHFTEMRFVAPSSRASPVLMSRLATGALIANGELIVARPNPGGGGSSIYYYNLDFTNAQVGSIRTTSHMDGTTSDEFTLRFATATLSIFPASTTFTQTITSNAMIYDDSPPDRPMLRSGPITALPFTFLQLDGINGGSTTKGHEGEFAVFGFEWRADRSTNSNAGGPDFGELRFVTKVSRGSPTLLQRLSDPALIASGILRLSREGVSNFVQYQSIAFTNALVSSHSLTTSLDGTVYEEFTLAFDQPADLAPPTLVSETFEFETGHAMRFEFSEDVGASLTASDFEIYNVTLNQVIPTTGYVVSNVGANTYTLSPPPGTFLPDGNYQVSVLAPGVQDSSGNLLLASSATPLIFHVLTGDANRDKVVNFDDLLIVAQNYGQSGRTYSQGNINYSANGSVDFDDLLILAQKYGSSLFSASAIALPTAKKKPGGRGMELVN